MARKTNKTSHVLNLLTNGAPETEELPAGEKSASDASGATASSAQTPASQAGQVPAAENKVIVVNETSENEKLSTEIKNRLEEQLNEEERAAQEEAARAKTEAIETAQAEAGTTKSKTEVVKEAQIDPEPKQEETAQTGSGSEAEALKAAQAQIQAAKEEAEAARAEAKAAREEAEAAKAAQAKAEAAQAQAQEEATRAKAEAEAARAEAAEAKAAQEAEEKQASQDTGEPVYHMVNVMEQVIDLHNLERHMEMYGVCTCSRCRADVRALILTGLPAKYVIVDETSTAPIIGYYEGKYRTRIFTEIMKACVVVKDSPRH